QQTLTTSDGGATWTLAGLSSITAAVGTYTLSLNAAGIQNSDGDSMANGTSVTWAVNSSGPVLAIATDAPNGAQVFSPAQAWTDPLSGDFNGDGQTDLLDFDPATGDIWVAVPQHVGGFVETQWGSLNPNDTWENIQVADVNGSGRDDLVAFDQTTGQWHVDLSAGTSFTDQIWATWNASENWVNVQVGNFTGDGRADIVAEQANTGDWFVSLSTGTSFTAPTLWASVAGINDWSDTQVVVGDFAGDGRSDLAIYDPDTGDLHVELSTGTYFVDQVWGTWTASDNWQDFMVGDFNGDEKEDIIASDGQDSWQIANSTGNSFTTSTTITAAWTNVQVSNFYASPVSGLLGEVGNEWEAIVAPETSTTVDGTLTGSANDWSNGAGTGDTTLVGDFQTPIEEAIADFEQVRNNVQFQAYFGEMKGPTATEETGTGNAWDQAAYLQQLLEADGISALLVSGEVEASAETVAQWLGATSSTGVPNIQAAENILTQAGLFVGTTTAPNGDTMVQFLQAWVQATLPGPTGMTTINLDPSWKFDNLQSGVPDILNDVPFNASNYYTATDPSQTLAYQYYENQVLSYLATNDPGMSLADVPHTGPIVAQSFISLPANNQDYEVLGYSTPAASFPESQQDQVTIELATSSRFDPLTSWPTGSWQTATGEFEQGTSGLLTAQESGSLALNTVQSSINETVEATVSPASGQSAGLVARYSSADGGTYYLATVDSDGNGNIYFVQDGVAESIATTTAQAPGTSGTLRFEVYGTSGGTANAPALSLYFNGTLIASSTSNPLTSAGEMGIYSSGANSTFTDWYGYVDLFQAQTVFTDAVDLDSMVVNYTGGNNSYTAELTENGTVIASANTSVAQFAAVQLVLDQYAPAIVTDTVNNYARAATQDIAIGINARQYSETYLDQLQEDVNTAELAFNSNDLAAIVDPVLSYMAADYWYQFNTQSDLIAGLTDAAPVVNQVTTGTVTNDIFSGDPVLYTSNISNEVSGEVSYINTSYTSTADMPDVNVPSEPLVDMPGLSYDAVPLDGTSMFTAANLVREQLIGWNASSLENQVIEAVTNEPSISTAAGLYYAATNNIHLYTFNPGTSSTVIDDDLTGYTNPTYGATWVQEIVNTVAAGYTVTVPQDEITVGTWTGMVFYEGINTSTSATYGFLIDNGITAAHGGAPEGSPFDASQDQTDSTVNYVPTNQGDPINIVTGTMTSSVTDISLPDFGLPLTFSREYDSSVTADTGLGAGWMDNYSDTLTLTTSTATWNTSTGLQYVFTKVNGAWKSPSNLFGRLTANGTIFTYTDTDGLERTFQPEDSVYRLTAIEDRNYNGFVIAYDSLGRITSVTDSQNSAEKLVFSYNGNSIDIASIADPSGRISSFSYTTLSDGHNYLTAVTNPLGQVTQYSYYQGGALDGLMHQITESNGGTYTYTYYPDRRGFEVIDPDGGMTHITYDLYSSTTSYTDQNGNATLTIYNATTGLVSEQITPDQSQDSYTWNPSYLSGVSDLMASHTNAAGEVETYTYNTEGKLTGTLQTNIGQTSSLETEYEYYTYNILLPGLAVAPVYIVSAIIVNPGTSQEETQYENFDSDGNAKTMIDAFGDKTTMTYGSRGQLVTEVEPDGNVSGANPASYTTTYTYNATGQVTSVQSPTITETEPGYNSAGQWDSDLQVTYAPVTTYTYDTAEDLLSTTDPDGVVTSYTYNLLGQRLSQTVSSPAGTSPAIALTTAYTYDSDGNLTSTTDALGLVTRYAYDLMNQLIQTTYADGTFTSDSYDDDSNVVSSTDALGRVTQYVYNSENRQVQVLYADGSSTLTRYNATGQVLASADADGNTTTYTYDLLGHVLTITNALGQTTTDSYDIFGNLHTTTDAMGAETMYDYDALNRVIETDGPDGLFETASFDADGNITTQIRYNVTGYSYAENGTSRGNVPTNLSSLSQSLQQITKTQYNPLNEPTTVTDPTGAVTTTVYDASGRVIMTTDPLGNETVYGYDGAGRKTTITQMVPDTDGSLRPGPTTTTAYNADSDVISATDPNGAVYSYTYDALNRQTSETLSTDPTGALSGTLISATDYDAAGNPVISIAPPVAGQTYDGISYDRATLSIYNDRNELIEVIGPHPDAAAAEAAPIATNQFDANGNLTASTDADGNVTYYTYNALNQLVSQTVPQPTSATAMLDEADYPNGFSVSGPDGWAVDELPGAVGGQVAVISASNDGNSADWTFDDLTAGTYEVYTTWVPYTNLAPDASFTVNIGNGSPSTEPVDEASAPSGITYDGSSWQSLGQYTIDGDSAVIQLSGSSFYSNVLIEADAVLLVRVSIPATSYTYNAEGDVTSTTDPLGNTTTYQYNYSGQKTLVTQPNPGTAHPNGPGSPQTSYQYNALGELTRVTDPMGYTTAYTYDADGRELTETDPDPITGQALDSSGDPIGPTTTNTYDLDGNLTSVTDPMGNVTEYVYNALNEKVQEIQPNPVDGTATGPETDWTYDNAGELVATTNALGATTDYVYDALGRQTEVIDAANSNGIRSTTDTTYDAAGDVMSVTTPDPATGQAQDADGNLIGPTTTYSYDNLGRKTEVTDPDPDGSGSLPAPVTSYTYDAVGNVLTTTDQQSGLVTTYTYNAQNQQTSQMLSNPGAGLNNGPMTSSTYDAAGELTSSTDANGNITYYTYNHLGQQTSVSVPEQPQSPQSTLVVGSNAVQSGTSTYNYSLSGLSPGMYEVLVTWTASADLSYYAGYGLTASGATWMNLGGYEVDQQQSPDPTGLNGGWYSLGDYLLVAGDQFNISLSSGDGAPTFVGNLEVIRVSNVATTTTYNNDNQTISTTDPLGNTTGYGYNALGEKTAEDDPNPNNGGYTPEETFTYNADGQMLTSTQTPNAGGQVDTTSYSYDHLGRRTSVTDPDGNTTTYTYNALGTQTSETDADGNLTTFAYNSIGQLLSETDPTGGVTSYTY
ncbi:MAG TPA: DUF6531 domain-containing protein, partial [Pirellulales bacterium]|nr:DUF6531 domain-containing protein [Pirellulales bacterium]